MCVCVYVYWGHMRSAIVSKTARKKRKVKRKEEKHTRVSVIASLLEIADEWRAWYIYPSHNFVEKNIRESYIFCCVTFHEEAQLPLLLTSLEKQCNVAQSCITVPTMPLT